MGVTSLAAKQEVCLRPIKRAKCRDFLAKSRSVLYFRQVSEHRYSTRFCSKTKNVHIFVDRLTVPLSLSVRNGVMFCNSWNCLETWEQQFRSEIGQGKSHFKIKHLN